MNKNETVSESTNITTSDEDSLTSLNSDTKRIKTKIVESSLLPDTKLSLITHSIFMPHDVREEEIASDVGLIGDTLRGRTEHFNVFYDSSLGNDGIRIADAILSVCEQDYLKLQEFFNGITPGGIPFNIHITKGSSGASHPTCASTEISIGARAASGVNIPFMCSLLVAEEDEVFEAFFGHGWGCGDSNGEGLSRILANEIYPNVEPPNFVSAPVWLDNGRPDYINRTDATDTNYISIGCSVLFLYWLHYQLNFSWKEIILAGAPTLAKTYKNLTGRTDGLERFKELLQYHFPEGQPSGVTSDNVFPLSEPPS